MSYRECNTQVHRVLIASKKVVEVENEIIVKEEVKIEEGKSKKKEEEISTRMIIEETAVVIRCGTEVLIKDIKFRILST